MPTLDLPASPALERSLTLAHVSLEPLEVTLDARALGGEEVGGTQVYLMGLLDGLAADERLLLRVLVGPTLAEAQRSAVEAIIMPGEQNPHCEAYLS